MKRIWHLFLSTGEKDFLGGHSSCIDIVATDKEIKQELLSYLKKVLKRKKSHRFIHAMLFAGTPRKGESFTRSEDIIRVKRGYSNRKLLRINNPDLVLVQGYGPEALEALGE